MLVSPSHRFDLTDGKRPQFLSAIAFRKAFPHPSSRPKQQGNRNFILHNFDPIGSKTCHSEDAGLVFFESV
jgi:hypothetical protein